MTTCGRQETLLSSTLFAEAVSVFNLRASCSTPCFLYETILTSVFCSDAVGISGRCTWWRTPSRMGPGAICLSNWVLIPEKKQALDDTK